MPYNGMKSRELRKLGCPFCDKGVIEVIYLPARVERKTTRDSGLNRTINTA